MRDPKIPSYSPAMQTGKPVISVIVMGKVLKSDRLDIEPGSIVMIPSTYTEEYSAISESVANNVQVIDPQEGVPLTAYMGILGITGTSASGYSILF